jgi:murein DD-endopeptidase MepM/ murein hydrolase activator NlpD
MIVRRIVKMQNKISYTIFFLALLSWGAAFAFDRATVPSEKDTVTYQFNPDELFGNDDIESFDDIDNPSELIQDETSNYDPNFDYYGIWDTISVNPYNLDLTQKQDTTIIVLQDKYKCDYSHPCFGSVTSDFGPRSAVRYHYGIDLKLATGDPVTCAFEGTVRIARRSSTFGNVVMVRHKNGLETIYAHLSAINVKIGQHVESGEILGLGGNTGHSFGSHLHYEVRYKGMPNNPNSIISFAEGKLMSDSIGIDKSNFNYLVEFRNKAKFSHQHGKHGRYYVVKKGDTLSKIAQRKHISLKKLCKINRIKKNSVLRPGKRLRLV